MKKVYLTLMLLIALLSVGCKEAIESIEVTEPNNSITFQRQAGTSADMPLTTTATEQVTATSTEQVVTASQSLTTEPTEQATMASEQATTKSASTAPSTAPVTTVMPSATEVTATQLNTVQPTTQPTTVPAATSQQGNPSNAIVDYDLTMFSETMVYSALFNMMINPTEYIAKTVRIRGEAFSDYDESAKEYYYFVVVLDEAACCQQGIEYRLANGNYPADGETITVEGRFEEYDYEVDGLSYYRLNDAILN